MAKKIPANGVTAEKVQNDAVFERTRENMAEFTRSGKASVSIRELFRELTIYAKSNDAHTRLVKLLSKVISTDPISKRGERTVTNGDLLLLKGFNFNRRVPLREIVYPRYTVAIDRAAGQATIAMPEFVPKVLIGCPKATTHFKLVLALATLNFETDASTYVKVSTNEIGWDQVLRPAENMVLNFPANTPDNIIVVMSVEFYQNINGVSYDLKTGQSNAAAIVAVSKP
ncbi:hypothetical protein [Paraflavitalea pollutisoli]|uniref:hypothetical protein n=1 Tax=Paraflavitalea pollutisoli TaxID=3034143 RepID=UPI0023ED0A27|nr:hypothetical protein [Paraflavitalea sp. H1-2-19X]